MIARVKPEQKITSQFFNGRRETILFPLHEIDERFPQPKKGPG